MEVIIQHNYTKSNYQYIIDKYILPIWFEYRDIDWIRYYPTKDGKMYKKRIVKRIKEEKSKDNHNLQCATFIYLFHLLMFLEKRMLHFRIYYAFCIILYKII